MSRHISSSSEDEAIRSESPTISRQRKKQKYQCPPDFVSFSHKPCSRTLTDSLKDSNTELWLIKAPNNFSPDCFSRLKMPLSGLQTMQAPAASGSGQIYSVLGGLSGTAGLHLLTSHAQRPDDVACGPAFAGLLNVCESYGDVSANQAPQAVPAPPAPCVPPGLRQRFQPFGSKTPTLSAAEREASPPPPDPSGSAPSPTSSFARPPAPTQEREEERRRKKKKRERSAATHGGEEEGVEVKEEPVDAASSQEVAPEALGETEERRKKKKKKRDKDRGAGEGDLALLSCFVKEEVEVKSEPMDCSYGDVEDSGKKKKKKKKKSNHDHD